MTDEPTPEYDGRGPEQDGSPAKGEISRRRLLGGGAALAAGGVVVTAWGVSPWIGDVFHRRGTFVYPNRPASLPGVETVYSVCKQCGSDCGLAAQVVGGVVQKLDGNPYHPASTEPHARYDTSPRAAHVWAAPHSLCARGQAGRQTLYDPHRLTVPLKRSGPRGSGKWEAISWKQLITEVVGGGYLFRGVSGERNRYVGGFADLWDHGKGATKPIDPMDPSLGSQTNGLIMYYGAAEAGQTDFITRFATSFGTVNIEAADAICDLNRMNGTMQSLDGMTDPLKPDFANSEYIIFFGVNVLTASFPMQTLGRKVVDAVTSGRLKYTIVDVQAANGLLHADRLVHVKPGGDGALAMGMVSWILQEPAYNRPYLEAPNEAAAQAAGFPNFTNASWLVVADPKDASYGQFLTPAQAGLAKAPVGGGASSGAMGGGSAPPPTGVVIDNATGKPAKGDTAPSGNLWPTGRLSTKPVKVNDKDCMTGLQWLWREASNLSIDAYAKEAGLATSVITSLAREFTSHGVRAVADFGRGPAMHTNGFYACRAIMTLNLLIGNIDQMGGYVTGAGGADYAGANKGAPYALGSWPGQPTNPPAGVLISRSGATYEQSMEYMNKQKAGKNPYPAKRPWFPLGGGQWPEMFAGIYEGYPYKAKILVQHMANPAWSAPALAGADNRQLPWQRLMTDTEKVPLFIACDTMIAESSSYADYIVPDTMYLECWEFPSVWPVVPTRTQGVRQPVVEPLTAKTPDGVPMSMEQFLIDVAKALALPGFGEHAFSEGGSLHTPEDLYLKMVANIAYDPTFQAWQNESLVTLGPVPDASPDELHAIARLRAAHPNALTDAQWHKAAYVLARGGRFENYEAAYMPNRESQTRLLQLTNDLILETGVERWAQPKDQISPAELRAAFARAISRKPSTANNPSWMANRYGSGGLPCQIYNPTVAGMFNAMTGEMFSGTATYTKMREMGGRLLEELDPPSRYPLVLSTYKESISSHSYTAADPWLAELLPEAFIDMCQVDAQRFGLKHGDLVRVWSSTLPKTQGMVGRLRLLHGVRPGVIVFPHGFGHWQYGSGTWTIDGKKVTGDKARNVPVRLNAVMRLDSSIAAPDGWSIGLMDPVAGGQAYFETRVAIEKV
jgi:tetrathionate reductase subunit A